MQHPKSLALLGAVCSFTVAAAGSVPRGVGPEFASYYQNNDVFACIANPSIKISLDRVNDGSCDCPDGSDEPGTAACAFIDHLSPEQPLIGSPTGTTNTTQSLPGFWCANKGHLPSYIPFSYVNDGICDYDVCCDGSDEYRHANGVKCADRCAEIGKEYRKLAEARRKSAEKASVIKQQMLKEAKELRQEVERRITILEQDKRNIEARKADREREYAEALKEDSNRVVKKEGAGGKLGVLVSLAKDRVEELREALRLVTEDREVLRAKRIELEAILKQFKEDYNPNFNDEGVKAAVRSWDDYAAREAESDQAEFHESDINEILKEDDETNGVNWKAFDEFGEDTDVLYNFDAYLPPFIRNVLQEKLKSLRKWLVANGLIAATPSDGSESKEVRTAREYAEAADVDLRNKIRDLEADQSDLQKDYGPSDIFRAIKGKCAEIDSGEYTYEVCWLDKTMQKSKKGHGSTNMGNFDRIDIEMADDDERVDGKSLGSGPRMVMRYNNGQTCWNGPQRRTDVWLGCAEKEEVWRVTEAEKCVYKMEVGTPAACEYEGDAINSHKKDEL
ncbi:hypothetical protein ACHAPX_006815 [Trichoderma viride]